MPPELKAARFSRQGEIDRAHRCLPDRTALLVIDMQHGFLDAGASLEVPKGRAIVPSLQKLIRHCRRSGVPVIYTLFVYSASVPCLRGHPFGIEHLPAKPGAATGYGSPSSNCLVGPVTGQGAESADVVPDLAPEPGELVIAAHTYDKFLGTPLDLALRSRGITHLLVSGVTTDVCVNTTVIAAAMRDYRVTALTDGVATIDDSLQDACFKIWERKFARLRTISQVLPELKRRRKQA